MTKKLTAAIEAKREQALLAQRSGDMRSFAALSAEVEALAEQRAGGHADEMETSVVLALRPDLVRMDLAPTDYGNPGGAPGPGYRPGGFSRDPEDPEYTTTGIFGDATLATPEKGRRVVEIMTREWLRALRAFATEPTRGGR